MKISLIGSGNVATHLGKAFQSAGHEIAEVCSRSAENAALLAASLKASALTDLSALSHEVDLLLIAVRDDAIENILAGLNFRKTIVAHTAGSIPMEILGGSSPNYGVFYPFQTFSKIREPELSGLPLCIEASNLETLENLEVLAKSINGRPYRTASAQRQVLHLAAVFACNFSNHLYAVAERLLEQNRLPFDLLRPLIKETAAKALDVSPREAQTGPAARGDRKVIAGHLALLEGQPGLKELYSALTESIFRQYNK